MKLCALKKDCSRLCFLWLSLLMVSFSYTADVRAGGAISFFHLFPLHQLNAWLHGKWQLNPKLANEPDDVYYGLVPGLNSLSEPLSDFGQGQGVKITRRVFDQQSRSQEKVLKANQLASSMTRVPVRQPLDNPRIQDVYFKQVKGHSREEEKAFQQNIESIRSGGYEASPRGNQDDVFLWPEMPARGMVFDGLIHQLAGGNGGASSSGGQRQEAGEGTQGGSVDARGHSNKDRKKGKREHDPLSENNQEQLNNQLISTARQGKLAEVRRLLKAGANPSAQNTGGYTPLHVAVEGRYLKIVRELLKYGADPDITVNEGGGQARAVDLAFCGMRPDPGIIEVLLETCSDFRLFRTRPMALFAIGRNWHRILEILLSKGVKPEVHLLKKAVKRGDCRLVNILLSAGANPDGLIDPVLSLELPAGSARAPILEALLASRTDALPDDGLSALDNIHQFHWAVLSGDIGFIQSLIGEYDVDGVNGSHQTALNLIFWHNSCRGLETVSEDEDIYLPVLKLLLENGADPDLPDEDGRTPLHGAVVRCKTRMAEMLIKAGANLNPEQGEHRLTPLQLAFKENSPWMYYAREYAQMIDLLLDSGARVGIFDENGNSLLQLLFLVCSEKRNKEYCEQVAMGLFNAGVDIDNRNNNGETIRELSCSKPFLERLVERLDKAEIKNRLLRDSLKNRCIFMIKQPFLNLSGGEVKSLVDKFPISNKLKEDILTTKIYVKKKSGCCLLYFDMQTENISGEDVGQGDFPD
ncbi:ankyrin repeat domain-containing protein [Endozoicomonas euniceicola]|uniref:Ankyrin repeat domain-containing protein n=1 Tax=Endozoicomonas euniceicola TaxID=1234143 RepID=A0ABY6GPI2_9GAMM|nr:ankyrin repeat domain-containing protein [Endozoicomonas euniceicola]UYM14023.1 ankyrin repeat domain-containing protein [Endozoicomonas euniceicola]